MIFTVVLLYPCLLLESVVSYASVDAGSHSPPVANQSRTRISNSYIRQSRSPALSNPENDLLENHSIGHDRPPQGRQVSTSEWIFSSLVQPESNPTLSLSSTQEQDKIGNLGLVYRSVAPALSPSNYYTHYYRNHNIYAQSARRIDEGDDKPQIQARRIMQNGYLPETIDPYSNDASVVLPLQTSAVLKDVSLNREKMSYPLSPSPNDVNSMASATPKMPEVLSQSDAGTTGLSRTAPATDPTLLITERPTSTQEMQISNDESSTLTDLELHTRGEIVREMKHGRGMSDATESPRFENAPIVFPGVTTVTDGEGTLRPYYRPPKSGDGFSPPVAKLNPFDARLVDGWKRLYELRQKSQSVGDTRKSSVASDQSADAKLISILTINGIPKCASKDGYCEEIETYPKSFLNQVLNKTLSPDIFKNIFGDTTENNSIVTEVEFKLRHDLEETPLCSVREHTIYPKAAQNRKGKYMFIVNHDEYLQGIRVETCTRDQDSCMFTEGHPPGYTSMCRQKYIYKKLLAFTPEGKAMPDTFRLPSCCVCHFRSIYISDRINPGSDISNSDVQPTIAADDVSWSPSSTSSYSNRDTSSSSTTESSDSAITFPTTSKDDLSSYQIPTPTTSTSSSQSAQQHTGGQQKDRADNQTANHGTAQRSTLRQGFIFIVVVLLLSFLLRL